jgi:MarR family transcriptional regulator for hemolysin
LAGQDGSSARKKAAPQTKTSFELYREGRTTPAIMLTIGLVLAGRRWRSLLDERLRPTGQSSARMETMAAILNSPPLSPQVDIAKRLKIEGPTLTRMIDTLEKDGLVERVPDPADRRTKQLRVTQDGESALEGVFAITDEMRARLLDGFSDDEIEQINRFLRKLIGRLDAGLS